MNEEKDWIGVLESKPVNQELLRKVSEDEVRIAVNGVKNGKALGPDGLPVDVWKLLWINT